MEPTLHVAAVDKWAGVTLAEFDSKAWMKQSFPNDLDPLAKPHVAVQSDGTALALVGGNSTPLRFSRKDPGGLWSELAPVPGAIPSVSFGGLVGHGARFVYVAGDTAGLYADGCYIRFYDPASGAWSTSTKLGEFQTGEAMWGFTLAPAGKSTDLLTVVFVYAGEVHGLIFDPLGKYSGGLFPMWETAAVPNLPVSIPVPGKSGAAGHQLTFFPSTSESYAALLDEEYGEAPMIDKELVQVSSLFPCSTLDGFADPEAKTTLLCSGWPQTPLRERSAEIVSGTIQLGDWVETSIPRMNLFRLLPGVGDDTSEVLGISPEGALLHFRNRTAPGEVVAVASDFAAVVGP